MKTRNIITLIAALATVFTLVGDATAGSRSDGLGRKIRSLDKLTDCLLSDYRREMRHCSSRGSARALYKNIASLENHTDHLRSTYENGGSYGHLRSKLSAIASQARRAHSLAKSARVSRHIETRICRISDEIRALGMMMRGSRRGHAAPVERARGNGGWNYAERTSIYENRRDTRNDDRIDRGRHGYARHEAVPARQFVEIANRFFR